MDEAGFALYMKEKRFRPSKIKSYTNRVKRFEKFSREHGVGKSLKDLTTNDLRTNSNKYVEWCEANSVNPYQDLWGVSEYYAFLGLEELFYLCSQVMQMIQLKKFKLKDFLTVNQAYAGKLAKIGIETASQILEAGKTRKERDEIATKSGIPVNEVLKFVKIANLARCPGHKKKRACLYYEAGLDDLDKIANQNPAKMVGFIEEFIKRSGFDGSAPTLGEAACSIENSKRIPRIIEF